MTQHLPAREQAAARATRQPSANRANFVRGFVAMMPMWTGAIPVGLAYGLAARSAGLGAIESQLMSLLVFSAAAQISAVALIDDGAPAIILLATTLLLNVQLLLLGLAAGRETRPGWLGRLSGAFFLTEGAYGVAAGIGRLTLPSLVGAGASMYLSWNIGTALGVTVGDAIPDPRGIGIDLVAPLAFLAVLVPLVRSRPAVVTVVVAAAVVLALRQVVPSGVAVLGAGLGGSLAGAWAASWPRRDDNLNVLP
jgi:predicted branched-subunit amino acid permease